MKGSHGSISKAGKSRSAQPKKWGNQTRKTKNGVPHNHIKKHKIPRKRNRNNFYRRVILEKAGNENAAKRNM